METTRNITYLQQTNNLSELLDIRWDPSNILFNSTCLTKETGFLPKIIAVEENWFLTKQVFRDMRGICCWKFPPRSLQSNLKGISPKISNRKKNYPALLLRHAYEQDKNCSFPILEAWCVVRDKYREGFGSFCAAVSKIEGVFVTSMYSSYLQRSIYSSSPQRKGIESKRLQSMAWLILLSERTLDPFDYEVISNLTIERNALVTRIVDSGRDETQINVKLLFLTAGSTILVIICTGVVGLFLWVKVIVIPNHRDYNRFCSPMDLLQFASQEAFGMKNITLPGEDVAIGIIKHESRWICERSSGDY